MHSSLFVMKIWVSEAPALATLCGKMLHGRYEARKNTQVWKLPTKGMQECLKLGRLTFETSAINKPC